MSRHAVLAILAALALALPFAGGCGSDNDDSFNWPDFYTDAGGGTTPIGGGGGGGGRTDAGGADATADVGNPACPPRDDPRVTYEAEDFASCAALNFRCDSDQVRFDSECGCGCVARSLWCPDALDAGVAYVGGAPSGCEVEFSCLPGWTAFDDECGCGCVQQNTTSCPAEKLDGIEPAATGGTWPCAQGTVCYGEVPAPETIEALQALFPSMVCDDSRVAVCPPGTVSTCGGAVGELDLVGIGTACGVARGETVVAFRCGG